MTPFRTILAEAERRNGGAAGLAAVLPMAKSPAELAAIPDDRYLSAMSLRIFRAGLKHELVDAKWPAFETVFRGFEPRRVRRGDGAADGGQATDPPLGQAQIGARECRCHGRDRGGAWLDGPLSRK